MAEKTKDRTSGGEMLSLFHGTPNMPLQLDSMTNSCRPRLRASGGIMYSTLRSIPYPPVIPIITNNEYRVREANVSVTLEWSAVCREHHGLTARIEFD
jgi:hypothetical protein